MMKKRESRNGKTTQFAAIGGGATLQNESDDSCDHEMSTQPSHHEMSIQREPREIMNPNSDRAELSDTQTNPPVEMDTHHHQPSTSEGRSHVFEIEP